MNGTPFYQCVCKEKAGTYTETSAHKGTRDAEKEQPASEWTRRKATEEASPAATGILNFKEPQDDQQTNFRC